MPAIFTLPSLNSGHRNLCHLRRGSAYLVAFALAAASSMLASTLHAQAKMVDTTPAPGVTAITGGKLLTITHGVIENGVVLMEGGKILAVGAAASVKIPKGAAVVDAKGMTVYPGLIDSETNLGLVEVESDRVNSDLVETSEEIFPQMHIYDAFHAETERIPVDRFNGVTNAIVAPESEDTMPGQDIFIQLAGLDRDTMIVTKDAALAMNFGQDQKRSGRGEGASGGAKFPSTRMGEISQLHQALIDATEYMQKKNKAADSKAEAKPDSDGDTEGGKGKGKTSKFDLRSEALIPYLKGERPVVLGAYESHDVETAMALAQEFHLKVVLNHVTHSQDILDKIAAYHVPVIFGPIYDFPGADERYDAVYSMPAELQKRGIKIAFASYGVEFNRNLPLRGGLCCRIRIAV